MSIDNLAFEKECLTDGYRLIAGVDEVGRGPLAGNVVCCAVIMPLDDVIEGVDDSKKLSEKKRKFLAEKIKEKAIAYSIAEISPKEIDDINILEATKRCMAIAINNLSVTPDIVLIDALNINVSVPVKGIVKGDALSYSIGAASILAKVYRDEQMVKMAEIYPEYAFDKNKGYGTAVHIEALKKHGATPIHRRSFIKNFIV